MIKFENVILPSEEQWRAIILGTRNAMNSWEKSDSCFGKCVNRERKSSCPSMMSCPIADDNNYHIGPNDLDLMKRLAAGGPVHAKYRRMITVYVDITAPLYWWKEFDTYKVGTVANSCSTMHKIHAKRFEREDFSIEHLENCGEEHWMVCMDNVIASLNVARQRYLETKDKKYWWQMIQLLPSSYNQKRTVMLNYEVLAHIYQGRKGHKLDEWREHTLIIGADFDDGRFYSNMGFCDWIKTLPYHELITQEETLMSAE